jgi:hypothetical protein
MMRTQLMPMAARDWPMAWAMANSERPQASDPPKNPIVSLRAPHCHSPQSPAQRSPPLLRATVSSHALPAAMPHDTEDGQHATRRRPASGHVHGCHVTCAPGDEPLVVAWDVPPYLPPPSAASTFLRVARFFWSPSTCCCISTMDDPSSFAEPSAPPIPGTCACAGR